MEWVEHFKTKKGLLENLGKKGDDTRCYDRMYLRGEVWHDDEGYYVINPALEVEELKKKVKKLEDMIALYDKVHNEDAEEYNKLVEEYEAYKRNNKNKNNKNTAANTPAPMSEEDKVNREYYMNLNEQKKEIIMAIIDDIYKDAKIRSKWIIDPEPEYKQKLYEKYWFSPREE